MSNLIDRQAAIDALGRIGSLDTYADREYATEIFMSLPSAQSEIIYCKDCTRYEKKNGRCNLVEGLNVATANSFCSFAERRTDEDD